MAQPYYTQHECWTCKRADVRLYRPCGEFMRVERTWCNAHIPHVCLDVLVPLRIDADGDVAGHATSAPWERWVALPDADPCGPTWDGRRMQKWGQVGRGRRGSPGRAC